MSDLTRERVAEPNADQVRGAVDWVLYFYALPNLARRSEEDQTEAAYRVLGRELTEKLISAASPPGPAPFVSAGTAKRAADPWNDPPLTEVVESEVEAAARRLREDGYGDPARTPTPSNDQAIENVRTVLAHVLNGGTL